MKESLLPGVVLATVCDENLLVATGAARGKVPDVKGITKSGAYLWQVFSKISDENERIQRIKADYGVPEETARAACEKFLALLRSQGYLSGG